MHGFTNDILSFWIAIIHFVVYNYMIAQYSPSIALALIVVVAQELFCDWRIQRHILDLQFETSEFFVT